MSQPISVQDKQLKEQNLDKVFREHCRYNLRELNALI